MSGAKVRFDPKAPIRDFAGEPVRLKPITDAKVLAEIARQEGEILRMSHREASRDEVATVPELKRKLDAYRLEKQPLMTLGQALCDCLGNPLLLKPGDNSSMESRSGSDKTRHEWLAFRIHDTTMKHQLVEVDDEQLEEMRRRIDKGFPQAPFLWTFDRVIAEARRKAERDMEAMETKVETANGGEPAVDMPAVARNRRDKAARPS